MGLAFMIRTFSENCKIAKEIPFQAFKMFPGWSKTKKHYNRIMEINYRQPKYIQI